MQTLFYDHSFEGFLTTVFTVYDQKLTEVNILPEGKGQASLFGESQIIITEEEKADRVWKRLKDICGSGECRKLFKAFLSEQEGVENLLLFYIRRALFHGCSPSGDYGDDQILKIAQLAKMVGREKHRMEAFIRFHLIDEDLYYANCEPDFNVLPLIAPHFKSRYADQKWVIYDLKRGYGLAYDLQNVQEIKIDFDGSAFAKPSCMPWAGRAITNSSQILLPKEEDAYRDMWNRYFKSTNIESRKNMKLHIQHVPKRYWKYLSEKVD